MQIQDTISKYMLIKKVSQNPGIENHLAFPDWLHIDQVYLMQNSFLVIALAEHLHSAPQEWTPLYFEIGNQHLSDFVSLNGIEHLLPS